MGYIRSLFVAHLVDLLFWYWFVTMLQGCGALYFHISYELSLN